MIWVEHAIINSLIVHVILMRSHLTCDVKNDNINHLISRNPLEMRCRFPIGLSKKNNVKCVGTKFRASKNSMKKLF